MKITCKNARLLQRYIINCPLTILTKHHKDCPDFQEFMATTNTHARVKY